MKNDSIVTFSLVGSPLPKRTTPSAVPPPALDAGGHLVGSLASSVAAGHVLNPAVWIFEPVGRKKLTPIKGGGNPAYSVPEMWNVASAAAPALRKFPVCEKPGIATAFAFKVTTGVADATLVSASTAKPTTARQVDALRISCSLLF